MLCPQTTLLEGMVNALSKLSTGKLHLCRIVLARAFHRVKIAGRLRGYIVVICGVILRAQMTFQKTARMRPSQ